LFCGTGDRNLPRRIIVIRSGKTDLSFSVIEYSPLNASSEAYAMLAFYQPLVKHFSPETYTDYLTNTEFVGEDEN
jgi:hypothetical protein